MTDRIRRLLEEAATCFDEGSSPFHDAWLSDRAVTIDECQDLSQLIALACRNLARLDTAGRVEALVRSTVANQAERDHAMHLMGIQAAMKQIIRPAGGLP
jgi:hypothetical protein